MVKKNSKAKKYKDTEDSEVQNFVRDGSLVNWINEYCANKLVTVPNNKFKIKVVSMNTLSKMVNKKHSTCCRNKTVKVEHMRVFPK